jgi:hypothetical protein
VYRYFSSKDELVAAVLPPAFANELKRKTRKRIRALGVARDVRDLAPDARYHVLAGDLLAHCLAHREQVVLLLRRPEGTPFEDFAGDFADDLVAWALAYARAAYPNLAVTSILRHVLRTIYANYLTAVADVLATVTGDDRAREAIDHLTAHHQGGLKRLFERAGGLV